MYVELESALDMQKRWCWEVHARRLQDKGWQGDLEGFHAQGAAPSQAESMDGDEQRHGETVPQHPTTPLPPATTQPAIVHDIFDGPPQLKQDMDIVEEHEAVMALDMGPTPPPPFPVPAPVHTLAPVIPMPVEPALLPPQNMKVEQGSL